MATGSVFGFLSDAIEGRDLLGVEDDAKAMASILLSPSLMPPLTIGVFGNWGSGKTFFLRRLRAAVEREATAGPSQGLSRVLQLPFNAWQYSEANLWASLAYVVFEGLRSRDEDRGGRRVDALLGQLETSVLRRNELEKAVAEATAQAAAAEHLLRTTQDRVLGANPDEISHAERDFEEATAGVQEAKRALGDVADASALSQFIARRAQSGEEGERLGMLALMRRDFEQLSLMLSAEAAASWHDQDDPLVERIILYIDDLDRCSPARVVATLEAVHLLLGFPLFVVVVAVDARWLSSALKEHFSSQLAAPGAHGGPDADQANTQDYLEKIFQVPYWLPPLSPEQTGVLLRNWLEDLAVEEDECLVELAPLIGRSPRAVKQFVNVYQFVRSSDWSADPATSVDTALTLLALALVHGAPELAPAIFNHVDAATDGTPARALVTSLDTAPGVLGSPLWPKVKPQLEEFARRHGNAWTAGSMRRTIQRARRFSFLDFRA